MEAQAQGLLERQALHETDEDMVTDVDFTNMISEEEQEKLKAELVKLEDEIATLRQVLAAKDKQLLEIKQKLGINLMNELKQNFSKSWHNMQTTTSTYILCWGTGTGYKTEEAALSLFTSCTKSVKMLMNGLVSSSFTHVEYENI
ncbi:tumor protein D53 homolog [Rhineura floridana]|uniref:tumor protein D53 homolog n=1 Tax=Rhineura floridana TaxID=261503 RepID=UPI002AC8096E|nr:tumor protein D53 homolog [Rhineura floridana]